MDIKGATIVWNKDFKNIKLNDPILIVGFPGIGNVGKLVVEHLKLEFVTKRIATLYSNHFPFVVLMKRDGTTRLVSSRFYLLKDNDKKHDIVLLTGDAQASTTEGQYEINNAIVKFFKTQLKGHLIYTIAGYSTGRDIQTAAKVFGNVNSKKLAEVLKKNGVLIGESKGFIYGSAGMLLAFAKMNKIDAACIMGETGMLEIDATAAKSILKILAKLLNLKINLRDIDKLIEETAKAVKEIEKQTGMHQIVQPNLESNPSYIR
ncbi:MAG: PAC2 family protein [Candidatus Marsarchaeota archaeon]|jgi:uncharacterized protein (TIGR00162 family)|nr:PAC2 family protein [Candidatus Marsarchaeota archaeon]